MTEATAHSKAEFQRSERVSKEGNPWRRKKKGDGKGDGKGSSSGSSGPEFVTEEGFISNLRFNPQCRQCMAAKAEINNLLKQIIVA